MLENMERKGYIINTFLYHVECKKLLYILKFFI